MSLGGSEANSGGAFHTHCRPDALRVGGPAPTARGFYDSRVPSSEAAHLRRMAGAADRVSLVALGPIVDRDDTIVADVGAGDSTSLADALMARNPTLTYLPVDVRPSAVNVHRARGFDGRVGSATDLPIADGTVDAFHARFVFAWLDPAGRRRAVEELLRVSKGSGRAVVIDYDWATAAGPEVLMVWKDKLLRLLAGFGFDPYYGQQLATDLRDNLTDAGLGSTDYSLLESRSTATERLGSALQTITETTAPVAERLKTLGLVGEADELAALHAAVVDHARRHPNTPITFPTMVATVVDLTAGSVLAAAATTIVERRSARRRAAATRGLPPAGPAELGVCRLESDDLIEQARRLQATEYLRHRHVTQDSIDTDGFLIADIDPPEVIARSRYFGVLDDEGQLGGCVRTIRPVGGDPRTLPTLGKLAAARGAAALTVLPFPTGSVLFEVSGLAKASCHQDRRLTTRLLLAVACEARRLGDNYAVMGVLEVAARLLMVVYGRRAIRPLDTTVGTITVAGVGIKKGGVTLIPCYSEIATFVHDLLHHCLARPDHELSRLNQPLIELTAAAHDWAEPTGVVRAAQPHIDPSCC